MKWTKELIKEFSIYMNGGKTYGHIANLAHKLSSLNGGISKRRVESWLYSNKRFPDDFWLNKLSWLAEVVKWQPGEKQIDDRAVTIAEFAERVGVSRQCIHSWIKRGKIPSDCIILDTDVRGVMLMPTDDLVEVLRRDL